MSCSTVTGATLYRPQLSAATLLRRRKAEHDALGASAADALRLLQVPALAHTRCVCSLAAAEKQLLEDKCNVARTASRAAGSVLARWGAEQPHPQSSTQPKKRGRPRGRPASSSADDDEPVALGSGATGRESGETLEIMRHGDFNALRCFGFLHVATEADRLKALSRSLRIFGIAFRGRQCPTIDENLKRIMYIGGLPSSHGSPEAVMDLLTARAGHLLTSAVDAVHAYQIDEEAAAHGQMSALAVQRATVAKQHARKGGEEVAACGQFLVQVQCPQAGQELLRRLVHTQEDRDDCDAYICRPMLEGHPVVARWADGLEERYLYATRRTEYELLNDED
jgi:hypothetical protein